MIKFIFPFCLAVIFLHGKVFAQNYTEVSLSPSDYYENAFKNNFLTVIFFLSPDCPLCRDYSSTIASLIYTYSNDSIKFYGIFSGKSYSEKEIQGFVSKYLPNLKIVYDPNFNLAKKLKARVTPESVLINSKGEVEYKGSIDNWIFSLGKRRQIVTESYLQNNISLFLKRKKIVIRSTKAYGCQLE